MRLQTRLARWWKLPALASAVVGAAVGCGLAFGGLDFLRQHFVALLGSFSVIALFGLVAARTLAMVGRGALLAVRRPRALGESGAAATEFIIVVIPFMLALTALMQLALASLARVLVSYSAFCAARAAIVLVPIKGNEGAQNPFVALVGQEGQNRVGYGANTRLDLAISQKASYIRNAAAYALIPASPSIDVVVTDTMHNWSDYAKNRAQAGLSGADILADLVGQVVSLPEGMLGAFTDQLRDIIKGGLDSPEQKAAAKAKVDAMVAGLPAGSRDRVRQILDQYIDNYHGTDAGLTGIAGEWVKNTIDDTLQGPLEKFKDGILGYVGQGQAGNGGVAQGGSFHGYSVDRALDAGFGAGTDGAGGAILRALRKLIYARVGTVVTLQGPDGAVKTHFNAGDPITAKVTFLYYCQIPIANHFAGRPFYDMPISTQLDMTTGPLKYAAAVGIPGYFMPLTATHTLINQGKPN